MYRRLANIFSLLYFNQIGLPSTTGVSVIASVVPTTKCSFVLSEGVCELSVCPRQLEDVLKGARLGQLELNSITKSQYRWRMRPSGG